MEMLLANALYTLCGPRALVLRADFPHTHTNFLIKYSFNICSRRGAKVFLYLQVYGGVAAQNLHVHQQSERALCVRRK